MTTPLESKNVLWASIQTDKDVFSDMIRKLGINSVIADEVKSLDDIGSLDKNELYGFILSYSSSPDGAPRCIGANGSQYICMYHQPNDNSAPTVALLNILCNLDINKGEILETFFNSTKALNSVDRGLKLGDNKTICDLHNLYSVNESDNVKECDPSNQYHAFIYKNNYLWKLDGQTNYPSREGKYTDCMDQLRRVLSRAHEEKSDVEIVVFAKHPAILMEDHLRDCIEELNKLDADIKNEIKGNLDPSEASQINSLSLTKAGRAIYADRNALEFVIRNIEEAIRRKRMEIEIKMNLFYEKRRAKLGWLPVSPSDHSTDQYESTPTSDFSSDRSDGSNHMENQDENVPAETSPKDEESTDQQERIPLLFSGYDLGDQLDLLEEQDEAVKAATSLKDQDSTILQQSTTPSVSSSDLTNVPELVEDHDEAVKEVTFLKKKTSTDQQLSPPPLSSDDNEVDGTGFIGEHSMTVVTALLELAKESTTFIGCEKEEKVTKPAGTDKDIRETGGEVKSDTENTPSTFQNRPKKRKRDSDDDDNSEEDMASCPSKKK